MELPERANKWAAQHPVEFAAIQMAIATMIKLVMGGHPTKSTEYVKGEMANISKKYSVPEDYTKAWVKQELNKRGIHYVHLE